MEDFDSCTYRDTMGQFCTGVVVVAGAEKGKLVGFAAQSFVSLSLEPPLVAVCPGKASTSWPRIRAAGCFCINILAEDQQEISGLFAQAGKTADIAWTTRRTGAPILNGTMAYVECALTAEHDAGDHTVAVGRALGFETLRADAKPLLYFRGDYGVS